MNYYTTEYLLNKYSDFRKILLQKTLKKLAPVVDKYCPISSLEIAVEVIEAQLLEKFEEAKINNDDFKAMLKIAKSEIRNRRCSRSTHFYYAEKAFYNALPLAKRAITKLEKMKANA